MISGVLIVSLVLLLLAFTMAWWVQRLTGNAGWVDVAWSMGTGLTGLSYLIAGSGEGLPRLVAGALLLVWATRLGGHIFKRVTNEKQEDGRYRAMRERLGRGAQPVFLLVFWAQAGLAWVFALPFHVIASQSLFHPITMTAGIAIGLVAICGEALSDHQLARFKARDDSHGRTCRDGLWRYSRHPNYFFEWLHWFSYPLIAVGAKGGVWLWGLPVLMLLFLWFVTGIPYTEKQALKSRGADYRDYQRTTSPFIPWRSAS
ncbi:hypothetical protein A6D6_00042 [Alcanivorax xiamenensis]|uniref:Steroid 5-alpha reductase family enzyme n=1 Tax=Alcanivorax xiamenensis TaxID=1177156 RepID=A0ABQ6YDB5_9GAMM|nr:MULTISPECIES: DUF1295 domain-containing protein [Alcanivorax]KAF0808333.1 hypothetical protein A6D6_00042 [Alcanivorax xiamenensis]